MDTEVVPFEVAHLKNFTPQAGQQKEFYEYGAECYQAQEGKFAFSLLVDGKCVACAGIFEIWDNRGHAWAMLSPEAGKYMRHVTKSVMRALAAAPWDRIEMDVACDFPAAHRWAAMLGFTCEIARREKFLPDGSPMALYSRVK